MRILITGGCGFIGSHLVDYHLAKGDHVRVVDDLSTGSLDNIASHLQHPNFQLDKANLLTWEHLESAVTTVDRIYHFAAAVGIFKVISDPVNVVQSNIIACHRVFQTIANSQSRPLVILASSSSTYGDSPNNPLNENDDLMVKPPSHPLATYAISKIADESIGLAYHRMAGIPLITVRLFNTVGPRQTGHYGMVIPRFVQQISEKQPFTIFGDGTQTRSFCDVRDVVVAIDLLTKQPKALGEIINVGNDDEISINQLAELVCKCYGKPNASRYIPYHEAYGTQFTDITQRRPDLSKLNRLTQFKHQWSLEETINDLIKHYQVNLTTPTN